MTRIFTTVLLLAACLGTASAQTTKAVPASAVETLKQLERDWIAAQKAVDIARLNQIIGDEWVGLGTDGAKTTKKEFVNNVKSGANKVDSIEVGPMDVMVIGTVGIVQGGDTEKSSYKGKDTSGKWAWMDVFVLRDGKWQAVRSQAAMVK